MNDIPSKLARRCAAAALLCVGLAAAASTAIAPPSFAVEWHTAPPPATEYGAPGHAPAPNGSEPRDAGDYALPDDKRPAEDALPDNLERHRDTPSPGCPYEEGPLNLIV